MQQRTKCMFTVCAFFLFAAVLSALSVSAITTDHWAIDYADFTTNMGIIPLVSRETFNAEAGFTRALSVNGLARIEGIASTNAVTTGFSDVPSGHRYAGVIRWGTLAGIVTGYDDGTFRPDDVVNRQEFCTFVYRYLDEHNVDLPQVYSEDAPFTDFATISNFARTAVLELYNAGLIQGYSDGSFQPLDTITYGEAAQILTNVHAVRHIPAENTVAVYVKRETNGEAVPNAGVYLYADRSSTADLYPEAPGYSNESGIATMTVSTKAGYTGGSTISDKYYAYAMNVIAGSYYGTKATPTTYLPGRKYIFVNLPDKNVLYHAPIEGFTFEQLWPHTDSCSTVCTSKFAMCPTAYYTQTIQQNFGWRYNSNGTTNYLEFHQAVDVGGSYPVNASPKTFSVGKGTPLYNVFPTTSRVIIARNLAGRIGKIVQIQHGPNGTIQEYATYMHMDTITVTQGATVAAGAAIGTVGNTGTAYEDAGLNSGHHLHLSIASTPALSASSPEQREQFIDPYEYVY